MFKLDKIGDKDYYINSQKNLHKNLTYADYLIMNNEKKPEFIGKLRNEYGLLNKDFDNEDFSKIYDGYKPNGEKAIRGAGTKEHQAGQEMCLTLPKSLSVLFATGNEVIKQNILEIIHSSTDEVINEVEKLLLPSNQGKEYRNGLELDKTEMIGSKFTHYENRNVDPHLHIHIQIFNQAKFYYKDKEPKIQAIDTKKLLKHQKELTQKVNALIITKLEKIGIKTIEDPDISHSFKIAGIPDNLCENLSGRSEEIKQWAKDNKLNFSSVKQRNSAYESEQIRKTSAKDKQELSYSEILNIFNQKLEDNNFNLDKFNELNLQQQEKEFYTIDHFKVELNEDIKLIEDIENNLISKDGYFTETQFNENVISLVKNKCKFNSLEEINEFTADSFKIFKSKTNLVQLADKTFTTVNVIKLENIIVAKATLLENIITNKNELQKTNDKKIVNEFNNLGLKLNKGQKEACELILKRKSIVSITGDAGTGKTSTAIKFANELHKTTNEVYGLATAGITSKSLQEANIKNTNNIAEFLMKYDSGKIKFNKPPTLIIDEAGMVSSSHMNKLLEITDKHKGNIILVGDIKQFASVELGNALNNINKNLSQSNQSRLDENMRQKNPLAKEIAESFRDKNIDNAYKLLKDNDLLKVDKNKDKVIDLLVKDFFNDTNTLDNKLVMAKDNSNVNIINDKIRTRLLNENKLDSSKQIEIEVKLASKEKTEGRFFTEEDKIIFNKKTKIDKNTVLDNGTKATIKSIDRENNILTLSVNNNGVETTVNLDTNKHKNFNHSYCQTAYKSQGQTVNNAYVFSTGKTSANQSYVEFSRHKEQVKLYLVEGTEKEFIKNAKVSQDKFNPLENDICKDYYNKVNKITVKQEVKTIQTEQVKTEQVNIELIPMTPLKPLKTFEKDMIVKNQILQQESLNQEQIKPIQQEPVKQVQKKKQTMVLTR